MGMVLRRLGELAGARSAHGRALAIHEAIYGADHPTLAVSLECLGLVLLVLGEGQAGRELIERAMVIFEDHHASDHWLVRGCSFSTCSSAFPSDRHVEAVSVECSVA